MSARFPVCSNRLAVNMLCAAFCAAAPGAVSAQTYPAKPIRFVVPFTPGGSQDIIARLVGQRLSERVGQQVVIDNRGGAAGLIAAEIAAHAPPDGHTIFMATAGPVTIAPSLHRKLSYVLAKDFAAVIHLVDTPMALVASNGLPAKSVVELVALAKSKSGGLNYASVGNGSISHLTMELFKQQAGVDLVHVPYKGAAPAFIDLIAGQVPLMFITTASAQPHLSAGKVRVLAIAARQRSATLPNVPTLTQAGIKGLEVPVWAGILTAARTPAPVINHLYKEVHEVLQLSDVRARLDQLGAEVVGDGPQPFDALLKTDLARWAKVIKTADIKLD